MNKNLKKRNKKGFTLIELVVVIAILGILAAILIPVIGGFIDRANIARDQANARNLFNCIAMVLATDGTLPDSGAAITTGDDLGALFGPLAAGWSVYTVDNGVVTSAGYRFNGTGKYQVYSADGFSES